MPRERDAEHKEVLHDVDPVRGGEAGNEDKEKAQLHHRHDEQNEVRDPTGHHQPCETSAR